jgi:hypothetical protein
VSWLEEALEEATPRESRLGVCFDGKLVSRYEHARRRLAARGGATMLGDVERLALEDEVKQLEAEVADKTRVFVFESIGWGPWRDLVAKHPPDVDQQEVFVRAVGLAFLPPGLREIDVNLPTFVPAAMAASCVEPGMTVEQAEKVLGKAAKLPGGVIDRFWAAVSEANLGGTADPFADGVIGSDSRPASTKRSRRRSS